MDGRIEKQLAFSLEIDKVKNIFRQTHLSDHGRNENDAERSWHMAVMASTVAIGESIMLRWSRSMEDKAKRNWVRIVCSRQPTKLSKRTSGKAT